MVSTPDLVGILAVLIAVPGAALLWLALRHRDRPGARGFLVNVVGWLGWGGFVGLRLVLDSPGLTFLMQNLALVFANLATLGWLLLAVEFTRRRRVELTAVRVLPLLVVPVVTVALAFTNQFHQLAWGAGSTVAENGVLQLDPGPAFLVDTLYMLLLAEAALVLVVIDALRSSGTHRRQAVALAIGHLVTVPFAMDAWWPVRPVPFLDFSPFGFVLGGLIWAWALFRLGLLEIVPVARERAVETMPDALVTVDHEGTVVDANPAARRLFSLPDSLPGADVETVFADYEPVIECYHAEEHQTDLSLRLDGETRHFRFETLPVGEGATSGRLLLFRDVTDLKTREEELDLLKQVLTRVLRHNIRNDVSAIKSYSKALEERLDGDDAELVEKILALSEDLSETSRKARHIERITDREVGLQTHDVVELVTDSVERVRTDHEDVSVDLDLPDSQPVLGEAELGVAFENVVENAVVHNDATDPHVEVTVESSGAWVTVDIADNGPGVPETEIEVLEEHQEGPLVHGSGVGLWLVHLILEHSDGELDFETTDEGTTVSMRLRRAPDDALTNGDSP